MTELAKEITMLPEFKQAIKEAIVIASVQAIKESTEPSLEESVDMLSPLKKKYMSADEVMEFLEISYHSLWRIQTKGLLTVKKIPGRKQRMYLREEVLAFFDDNAKDNKHGKRKQK